jgi:acetolactate synthase-1/2/3 large subunit
MIPRPENSAHRSNRTVCHAVVDLLLGLGVRSIYGILGGSVAPFADVLAHSTLAFHAMRHEAGAVFSACEASLAADRPAAVLTSTGPGLTNALTGLLAARSEGARVILVSACTDPRQRGRFAVQETSEHGLVTPALLPSAFDFSTTIEAAEQMPGIAGELARGLGRVQGFVGHLSLCLGAQRLACPEPLHVNVVVAAVPPSNEDVEAAARALAAPFAIWAGFGARSAAPELLAFAEKTGAPVALTPRAKGVFPEDHPQFLGVTGIGGHDPGPRLAAIGVERVLVLGSRLGEFSSCWCARMVPSGGLVHVDVDPSVFRAAYPDAVTLAVVADVRSFLVALAPRVAPRTPVGTSQPPEAPAPNATTSESVRPQVLMQALQDIVVLGSEALVFAECGNSFAWAINLLRFKRPAYRMSGYWGSMGHMSTGAVGAALETARLCVVITGDGSMLMLSELSTAAHYGARVVWIVLNDARYGMTEDGMRALGLTPIQTTFPRCDFVALARSLGADGAHVSEEAMLHATLARALASKGPFVVDVDIDTRERAPFLARVRSIANMGGFA